MNRSLLCRPDWSYGLMWDDLDLDEGLAYNSRQVQQDASGQLRACPLKTESGRRAVALEPQTVTVLRAHRSRQQRWLSESGIRPGSYSRTSSRRGRRVMSPGAASRT